jgi:hypothetical protein
MIHFKNAGSRAPRAPAICGNALRDGVRMAKRHTDEPIFDHKEIARKGSFGVRVPGIHVRVPARR